MKLFRRWGKATAIGPAGKNININGAAFGAENHTLEKDVDFSE
jgi:hypothetical protein